MGMEMNGQDDRTNERPLIARLRRFLADTSGATAMEYGLIVALLSVALIATIATMSGNMKTVFTTISTALK